MIYIVGALIMFALLSGRLKVDLIGVFCRSWSLLRSVEQLGDPVAMEKRNCS